MPAAFSPGPEHHRFVKWAKARGIVINGVAPAKFEGRGLGIVAARDLEKGETLVTVPTSALLTVDSKPVRDCGFPKTATVQGRLAAYLALNYDDTKCEHRPWQDIWPSQEEFDEILSLNWNQRLQELLPATAKELLHAQQAKFQKDWAELKAHLSPKVSESLFRYTWMIVNTRCFYWDYPNLPASRLPKKRSLLTANDCETLSPFMDFFNHSVDGCETLHNTKGYTVTANKSYNAGDEVYVTYGAHTNDFLLVEYGFILRENYNDDESLDHLILPKLSKEQAEILKEDGFYGKYTLSIATHNPHPESAIDPDNEPPTSAICHRTQAALRLLTVPSRRYTAFISGQDHGAVDQPVVNAYLHELLHAYQRAIVASGEEVLSLENKSDRTDVASDEGTRKTRTRSGSKAAAKEMEKEKPITADQKETLVRLWKDHLATVKLLLDDMKT